LIPDVCQTSAKASPTRAAAEAITCKETAAVIQSRKVLTALTTDQRGVTALEYAMIASLIAVAAVTAITGLGINLSGVLLSVSSAL
jgi:pilus assembly protein Flp/PilA